MERKWYHSMIGLGFVSAVAGLIESCGMVGLHFDPQKSDSPIPMWLAAFGEGCLLTFFTIVIFYLGYLIFVGCSLLGRSLHELMRVK